VIAALLAATSDREALHVIGWIVALCGVAAAGYLIYLGRVAAGLALGLLVIVAAVLLL
jgi:hypothetical protein